MRSSKLWAELPQQTRHRREFKLHAPSERLGFHCKCGVESYVPFYPGATIPWEIMQSREYAARIIYGPPSTGHGPSRQAARSG